MKELIENSKAYQSFEPHAQQMVIKRVNRLKIEDAIIQARHLGLEQWNSQTDLPHKWRSIVKEIVSSVKTIKIQRFPNSN
ncbi:hypothetical protein ACSV4D_09375 [Flavobacterium sp. ARAG 55.4]|uniref:hypothetical protein n=1 Tax=Flavobacterium sp. ARAG 55.4 TaxID=3451357 RepID=UPI003F46B65E